MKKLESISVLRAVAATTVIYFHIMAPTGHTFGEFGVDIFFVISGFVIALVLDNPKMTTRRFLADRIARIVPLYWLLTFAVFAGALIAPSLFNSTTADFESLLKSLLFIPYRKESGAVFPMLFVGWTLNYEMLFYAVTAISLMLTRRHRLPLIAALIFVIFCAANAWAPYHAIAEFYSDQRIFEFPLGFVIYRLWKFGIPSKPVLAVGVAAAAYAWMAYVNWHGLSHAMLLYYGIPACLVVISSLSLEAAMGSGLLTRAAIFVGNASYAVYLSHPYCVEAARKLLPQALPGFEATAPAGVVVIILVATAVGGALYVLVDKPLHLRSRQLLQSLPPLRARRSAHAGLNPTLEEAPRNVSVNHDAG